MAEKTTSGTDERTLRRMGVTGKRRPAPTPTVAEIGSAAIGRWTNWALVAVGIVLLYVSLFVMDDGPVDDLLFGLLTFVAVVAAVQGTVVTARAHARRRLAGAASNESR